MAAARVQREAPRLLIFCKLTVVYVLVASLLLRGSLALLSYNRQQLLDIGLQQSHIVVADHLIPSEITRTPGTNAAARPAGRAPRPARARKHKRGARGGVRKRLKLNASPAGAPQPIPRQCALSGE